MRGTVALLLFLFFALIVGVMCVPGVTSNGAHYTDDTYTFASDSSS